MGNRYIIPESSPCVKSFFNPLSVVVCLLFSAANLTAQCVYVPNSNPMTFTGDCPLSPGATLFFPDNSNPPAGVPVPLNDLRGVTVLLGQNVDLTFDGGTVTDADTRFAFNFGGNDVTIIGLGTFSSSRGNNPDGLGFYSNSLAGCTGVCTLGQPSVLPVTLTSFTAAPSGKSVLLRWETASEDDNRQFTVERGNDASEWFAIGKIAGSGTTSTTTTYTFIDDRPLSGTAYYRLRQEDFDGTTSVSGIRTVSFSPPAVRLFPNPTAGELNVTGAGKAEIFSVTGRNVTATARIISADGDRTTFDLSNLPRGTYLLRTAGETKRFVKL